VSPRTGRFITFEGVEGSGKSTQWRRTVKALEDRGVKLVATREPGGTPIGAELRALLLDPGNRGLDPRAELLLYCADRVEHMVRLVLPALDRGVTVLCDRYSDATVAYQAHARGLGVELVERVNLGHRPPDLTLLYDVPVDLGLERARGRNLFSGLEHEARFEQEALAFHERVRAGYLAIAAQEPKRVQIVDGARSEDEVFAATWRHVASVVEA